MKNTKKVKSIAKVMFKKSLTDGLFDEKRAKAVLSAFIAQKPTNLKKVLKNYKNLVEVALKKEEVIVESAAPIVSWDQLEKELLSKTHAKRAKFRINPRIVVGAKVTHGDWIWDESLQAKLSKLLDS